MPADTDQCGMAGKKAASWRGKDMMWAVASPILILVKVSFLDLGLRRPPLLLQS